MIVAHRIHNIETSEIVFVRRVITMPRNNVKGRMADPR